MDARMENGHEALLASAVDHMDQGLVVLDADLNIVRVNERAWQLYDSPAWLRRSARTFHDLLDHFLENHVTGPEAREGFRNMALEGLNTRRPQRFSEELCNGRVLEVRSTPLPDGGFARTYTDITEQKHLETQIRESETLFRTVADTAPFGLVMTRRDDNRVIFFNEQASELFALPPDTVVGHDATRFWADPDQRAAFVACVAGEGPVRDYEARLLRNDGTPFPALLSAAPVTYRDAPALLVGIMDITARKQAEESLVEQEKMAALGRLVAGLAHEVNTPLGNALSAASMLADDTRAMDTALREGSLKRARAEDHFEKATEAADIAVANLRRAADLMGSFKAVSADQAGDHRRTIALGPYLDEVLMTLRPQVRKAGASVTVSGDREVALDTWPGALAQAVSNIVANALAHAFPVDAPGTIELVCSRLDGDGVRLAIRDDGAGMPEGVRRHVFEPFFTTRRGEGGTGLGLHIAYSVVTGRLGGRIGVTVPEEGGTVFTLDLPLTAPEAEA